MAQGTSVRGYADSFNGNAGTSVRGLSNLFGSPPPGSSVRGFVDCFAQNAGTSTRGYGNLFGESFGTPLRGYGDPATVYDASGSGSLPFFAGSGAAAGGVSHDATGSGSLPFFTGTSVARVDNWEAYSKFTLPLTLDAAADREVIVTVANDEISKEYKVTVPHGATYSAAIDTQIPTNVPSGFNVDRRSSRYPLLDQVGGTAQWGPLAASMNAGSDLSDVEGYDDDPESVRGWLWGCANVKSVTVSCPTLATGETLTVGALTLVKTESTLTLASGFTAGATGYDGMKVLGYERAIAGGVEVAHTEGDTHSLIKVDGRWLDLPSVWRRVPAVGSTGPVFTTLSAFGLLWNAFPGLHWTAGPDPACPYVDNSAFGLFLQGVGGKASYSTNGTIAWSDAFEGPLGVLDAQEQIGDVNDYPGMGNPWRSDGLYGIATPYGGYKQTRSWAEGRVYDPSTFLPSSGVTIGSTDDPTGISSGSGTSDTMGHYRTGTPWWRAERDHAIVSPSFTDDPRKAFNRRRVRACFLALPGGAANPHLAVSPMGSVFLAYGLNGTVRARHARGPYAPWEHDSLIDSGPNNFRPRIAYDHATKELLCAYERTGTCRLRRSTDGGKTWGTETNMGTGYRPEIGSSHTGGLIHLRLEDVGGGEYQIYVKHRTDAAGLVWSSETLVTDESGNPVSCSLEGWGGIVAPWDLAGGWLLSIVPFGESDPVRFLSRERKALSFKRVS